MTRGERRKDYMREWYLANKEKQIVAITKWQKDNPDKVRKYKRNWCAANPEKRLNSTLTWRKANPEKVKKYSYDYDSKNREKRREKSRKYRELNREQTRACNRRWSKDNPEKARVLRRNYTARKQQAEGRFTAKDIKNLYATQGGRCYYCRIEIEAGYHIDHMFPISRGGTNWPENLALACVPCNLSKHTKTAEEFMAC